MPCTVETYTLSAPDRSFALVLELVESTLLRDPFPVHLSCILPATDLSEVSDTLRQLALEAGGWFVSRQHISHGTLLDCAVELLSSDLSTLPTSLHRGRNLLVAVLAVV